MALIRLRSLKEDMDENPKLRKQMADMAQIVKEKVEKRNKAQREAKLDYIRRVLNPRCPRK